MNGSIEDQCGGEIIHQYSNTSVSSSPTNGDFEEATFLQDELQRHERILDSTRSGIVLATNTSRSDSWYYNDTQHQPSLFTPASFNSTETSLKGISPNGYDDRYLNSDDLFLYDSSALEFYGPENQHLV